MNRPRFLRSLAAALIFIAAASGCRTVAEGGAGRPAPGFTLTDIAGQRFSLADYKGKAVLIDFWATWCPPCVMSSPEVDRLAEEYKDRPLAVLSLSLDESSAPVIQFLSGRPASPVRVAVATGSGVDEKYKVDGIPAFFLVNQKGEIVKSWVGFSPAMPAMWRKEIDYLLKN